jgi:hypothetical protein
MKTMGRNGDGFHGKIYTGNDGFYHEDHGAFL